MKASGGKNVKLHALYVHITSVLSRVICRHYDPNPKPWGSDFRLLLDRGHEELQGQPGCCGKRRNMCFRRVWNPGLPIHSLVRRDIIIIIII
jgi:hypothetical protein